MSIRETNQRTDFHCADMSSHIVRSRQLPSSLSKMFELIEWPPNLALRHSMLALEECYSSYMPMDQDFALVRRQVLALELIPYVVHRMVVLVTWSTVLERIRLRL
jgi:hypothetical protein